LGEGFYEGWMEDALGSGGHRRNAMPIEFKEGGSGYSLGVEEELHIVDATTGSWSRRSRRS
jgi:hypothetical protein